MDVIFWAKRGHGFKVINLSNLSFSCDRIIGGEKRRGRVLVLWGEGITVTELVNYLSFFSFPRMNSTIHGTIAIRSKLYDAVSHKCVWPAQLSCASKRISSALYWAQEQSWYTIKFFNSPIESCFSCWNIMKKVLRCLGRARIGAVS